MHCVAGVQAVLAMSESTCRALCYSGADCKAVSEPTCRALCYSGADCLSGVRPTCWALCYSGEDCLSGVGVYLPGTVLQW